MDTITNKEHIALYRMIALKNALKLEKIGLCHSSGVSAYSIIKKEFNLKGNKAEVLESFEKIISEKQNLYNKG